MPPGDRLPASPVPTLFRVGSGTCVRPRQDNRRRGAPLPAVFAVRRLDAAAGPRIEWAPTQWRRADVSHHRAGVVTGASLAALLCLGAGEARAQVTATTSFTTRAVRLHRPGGRHERGGDRGGCRRG